MEPGVEGAEPSEDGVLGQWLSSERILEWARLEPALGAIDLRPYLFVTRDRKDYLAAASALGKLQTVVDQLLGPKWSVQALEAELRRLSTTEAAQVFEAVRARIGAAGSLEEEPPGAAGLEVLVRAQPSLQPRLLDYLERLPTRMLGSWVVGGWARVLESGDAKGRLGALLDRWSSATDNTVLRASAAAAKKLRTRSEAR
jgi:hypothetical protein